MAKNSVIVSVSIPQEHARFLDEKGLSPSELIQEKIMEQKKIFDALDKEKEVLKRNILNYQSLIQEMYAYLDLIDKTHEYSKWRSEKHVVQTKI